MILHELISYDVLRLIWWLLLGILLVGFAIIDGFDLGVGMLLPFACRKDVERRVVINTVGPVWEGNQVWLILGGGAIFAAWPQLYAASFSGFYLAMFVFLSRSSRGPWDLSSAASARSPRGGEMGLGDFCARRRALADLRRGDGQRAAGGSVPARTRHADLLRRHLLRPAQSLCRCCAALCRSRCSPCTAAAWLQVKTGAAVFERARSIGIRGGAARPSCSMSLAGVLLRQLHRRLTASRADRARPAPSNPLAQDRGSCMRAPGSSTTRRTPGSMRCRSLGIAGAVGSRC